VCERIFIGVMVFINNFFGCNAFVVGRDSDGNAVFVRAADEESLLAGEPEESDVHIGGDICSGAMPEVQIAVGVGQGGGYEVSFHGSTMLRVTSRYLGILSW